MATYKKKAAKKAQGATAIERAENNSATAEVFKTLNQSATRSEQWIEKNQNYVIYIFALIILSYLGYMGYNKYVVEPTEKAAADALAYPKSYFNKAINIAKGEASNNALNLALEGAGEQIGFVEIADKYSGTKAGNLANYYAGISYLNMSEYTKGISHLKEFEADDELLGPIALGAIADALLDSDQQEEALEYYIKAATKNKNVATTPIFLMKAGNTALLLKKYNAAATYFEQIKNEYPNAFSDIDVYINQAQYAQ